MKVTITKEEFYKKLSDMQGIVEKRSNMPATGHILFNAEPENSFISASDLETVLKESIDLKITTPGKICIPARKVFEIVKEMQGNITLSLEENDRLKLRCGNVKAVFSCLPANEFPSWPSFSDVNGITMNQCDLKNAIEKVTYAIGEGETKRELNGFLVHILPEGRINFVGSDGRRMSVFYSNIDTQLKTERQIIISKKSVLEIKKFLSAERGETVEAIVSKNHILFKMKNMLFLTRLIEGNYPNYNDVIPQDNSYIATFSKEDFLRSLRIVSIMSREKSSLVVLSLQDNVMSLHSSTSDLGECKDEISVRYANEPITLSFNARYLIEAVQQISDEYAVIKMETEKKPVVIHGENSTDYMCVVMPIRN